MFVRVYVLSRYNTDGLALFGSTDLEFNIAVCCCKQGVVTAHADVVTGVELGAALTYQDVTSKYSLTAESFHTKSFGFRLASVTGTARSLFMCHI